MTIHASKGLEFPVVICVGGIKGKNSKIKPGYLFHDDNNDAKLGFSKFSKDKMFKENDYEWQRIFYVAYTRASALLILPFYDKWENNFSYLNDNISSLFSGPGQEYIKQIHDNNKKYEDLQSEVQTILKELKKIKEEKNPVSENITEEGQLDVTKNLSDKVPELLLTKHSYSSLSHRKAEAAVTDDTGARTDKDGSTQQPLGLSAIDNSENPVKYTALPEDSAVLSLEPTQAPANFPKGKKLGIALHEVFEKADFVKSGNFSDYESVQKNEELYRLISACFERQTFNIPDKDPDHWLAYTASLLWNTLNAKLPEISGSTPNGSYFSLKEIDNDNRISEAEFNINADFEKLEKNFLKNYCNGFMDLVFRRIIPETGKEVYCVLDWKSDFFEGKDYSKGKELASHTNNRYSIQRVLYSYSLVKWLCSFYADESEEEVFENHFGGIYYVYVRGAVAGSCSGIYARTWKSWQELEAAFKTIFEEFQIKNARGL
jgi:exodeoxyribonuclease V beta subunit